MPATLNRLTIAAALRPADVMVTFGGAPAALALLQQNYIGYIDREAIRLQRLVDPAVPGVWRVQRGVAGTPATAHAVNNQIYVGAPGQFYVSNPSGSSSLGGETILPYINIASGDMFTLSTGGSWQQIGEGGVPQVQNWASGGQATYTTAGAITPVNGMVVINSATGRAMTLAAPTQADDGMVMQIVGTGGGAHTVTVSAGFNGAGGAYDIATFAATGGTLVVQVADGVWRVLSAVGVTIA